MNKLVIANWKMNPQSQKDAERIFSATSKIAKTSPKINILVCLPFPYLHMGKKFKIKNLSLGAQDVSASLEGAHTGEVSIGMLKDLKVSSVIIGHSEKRASGDTNILVNKKVLNALKAKISPVLCVGESTRDASGEYLSFIKNQIHECLGSVTKSQMKDVVIAYEPIWAIGEKAERVATPEEFTEIRIFIKKTLSLMYDMKTANGVLVIYGGSVHPDNASSFVSAGADGLLVGRDSLSAKNFNTIVKSLI